MFVLQCCHATCKDRHGGHFLDESCQQFGLTVSDLLAFVDLTEDEMAAIAARKQDLDTARAQSKGARESWAEIESIARDVMALQAVLSGDDVERALRVLATFKAGSYEPRRSSSEPPRVFNLARAKHIKELAKRLGTTESCLTLKVDGLHQDYREAMAEENAVGKGAEELDALEADSEPFFANDYERLEATRKRIEDENDPPSLFRRDGVVVRIIGGGGANDAARVEELSRADWINELVRCCGDLRPADEVSYFMGIKDWRFPYLRGLTNVPTFNRDGTLRTRPGYDPVSRTQLLPGFEMEPVPAMVSPAEVEAAKSLLLDPLCDFPFTDVFGGTDDRPLYLGDPKLHSPNLERGAASRANLLALTVQPFVRQLVDGPFPGFHVDKADNGEGGTLLTHHPAIIYTGAALPATPMSNETPERQKALLAILRAGAAYVMFDNKSGLIDDGDLASAITESRYQGRLLGESTIVQCDVMGSFVFNGVALTFSRELARRMVPIRLETGMEDPTARNFKYDFDAHLKQNRRQLVWAVHVLVLNWLQHGRPAPTWKGGGRPLASFEAWSTVLGGILECAGISAFLANVADYRESMRDGRGSELALVEALARAFGGGAFSAAEVLGMLGDSDALGMIELKPGDGNALTNKRMIARYIQNNLRRTWGVTETKAISSLLPGKLNFRSAAAAQSPPPAKLTVTVVLVRDASPMKWQIKIKE
jgi:hypothetical protein